MTNRTKTETIRQLIHDIASTLALVPFVISGMTMLTDNLSDMSITTRVMTKIHISHPHNLNTVDPQIKTLNK